jgi:hypothetical protein
MHRKLAAQLQPSRCPILCLTVVSPVGLAADAFGPGEAARLRS